MIDQDNLPFVDKGAAITMSPIDISKEELRGTTLCSQNIRSIYKNLDGLLVFLVAINLTAGVICLQETWSGNDHCLPQVNGYDKWSASSNILIKLVVWSLLLRIT